MLLGFTADSDSKFLLVLYVTQTKFFNGNKMKITPVILYLKKKTYLQYPPSCLLEDDRISASIVKANRFVSTIVFKLTQIISAKTFFKKTM